MTSLAERWSYFSSAASFIANKHLRGFQINPTPSMDPQGLAHFEDVIAKTSVYLEYGSGGSTLTAARKVRLLVSVESDRVFRNAVRVALDQAAPSAEVHLLAPRIGATREWGYPIFGRPNPSRVARWQRYPKAPWLLFKERQLEPETILIDGRFRVACALESLLNVSANTRILIDDYVDRTYGAVEQFTTVFGRYGRMVELRKSDNFCINACEELLRSFYADAR